MLPFNTLHPLNIPAIIFMLNEFRHHLIFYAYQPPAHKTFSISVSQTKIVPVIVKVDHLMRNKLKLFMNLWRVISLAGYPRITFKPPLY